MQNNGGTTPTYALVSGSVAIDAGSNSFVPPDTFDLDGDSNTSELIPFDQRGLGFPRIKLASVDIGAYEFGDNSTVSENLPFASNTIDSVGIFPTQFSV